MIKWLLKYGVVIFLFNTVLLSIKYTQVFGYQLFVILMSFYAIILLMNPNLIKTVVFHRPFVFLLLLNLFNLFYFILFHSFDDINSIKYLMARGVAFSLISISIYFNSDYYKTKFLDHLIYLVAFIVVFSLLINPSLFSGRYSGIIWNPNMLSSFTSIGFAVLFLNNKKRSIFDLLLLVLFLLVSLSTGSRSVILAIILVFLFKYRFTISNIIYSFLGLSFYFILITLELNTSVNRLASQSLFNDRLLQYFYAYETFLQKPFFGHGLDKYAYIDSKLIPDHLLTHIISAHNGYLAIYTQYGAIFGSLVLFIIFRKSIQVTKWYRNSLDFERTYLFIIIYGLIASIYETLITGINEFDTILFWISLSFLSFLKYRTEHEN